MANINGMLLAAGTTELPDSISYAYVVDPDYPEGKPLVGKDFKHRSVDLAAKGGKPAAKATPNAPKNVEKKLVSAPLSDNWHINCEALRYEHLPTPGVVTTSSLARPIPPAISSSKLPAARRLRREYELSILQVSGQEDSDSYLSFTAVKQRDKDFNFIFGIPSALCWLAHSKDVPETPIALPAIDHDAWELADAQKSVLATGSILRPCLDRVKYWEAMGGGLTDGDSISAVGTHKALSKWHQNSLIAQLSDSIEILQFAGGTKFCVIQGQGEYIEFQSDVEDVLCFELFEHQEGASRKLDQSTRVDNAPLKDSIKTYIAATAPLVDFSRDMREPQAGTPKSLMHGLRLIADQVKLARPKKRRKVSALKDALAQNKAMRSILTVKTFELAMTNAADKDDLIETATKFVGFDDADSFFASDIGDGANLTASKKKAFAKSVFEAFMDDEEVV